MALAEAGLDVVLAAGGGTDWREPAVRSAARPGRAPGADRRSPTRRLPVGGAGGGRSFGHLDVLVNNAGLGIAVPAPRETPEQFREVIEVNPLGAYWMAQAAAHVMPPGSAIVNIASVIGLMKSFSPQAAYAASKTGLIGLTRAPTRQPVRPPRDPGQRGGARVLPQRDDGYHPACQTAARVHREHLHARADGEQHELDAAVVFLASPASSYIAGVMLAVDGGMSGH